MGNIELIHFDKDTIFHYCSLESFVSIIKNKEMWMSRIEDTNDPNEHKVMDYKIRCIADELAAENPELDSKCQEVKDMFQDEQWYDEPYIACFSGSKDNLNQWRLYAEDARGIAIGFSVSALAKRHFITSNASILRQGYTGYKVLYLTDNDEKHIKEEMRMALKDKDAYYFSYKAVFYTASNDYVKDGIFKTEDEYRILYNPQMRKVDGNEFILRSIEDPFLDDNYDFRFKNGLMLPYYRLSIEGCVKEVVIGVKCSIREDDLRRFLDKHNFNDVDIYKSDIQYK